MNGLRKKLIAFGVLFTGALAAQLAMRGSDLPNEPADAVMYVCETDGTTFSLTPRELAEARDGAGEMRPGYAPCSKCGKMTGVRARIVDGKPVAVTPPNDEASELFQGGSRK